jgi:hypothetical protein
MAQYKREGNGSLDGLAKFRVDDIQIRRLEYAGHIIRKEEESIPRKALNGKLYNRRSVGKLRTRWKDVVRRDALQVKLGIEKNEGAFSGRPGPRRGCSFVQGWTDGFK